MNTNGMNMKELTRNEMSRVAGGDILSKKPKSVQNAQRKRCADNESGHVWVKTGHYEDEWFSWIKEGGLFSRGFDTYVCSCCGKTKEVHV